MNTLNYTVSTILHVACDDEQTSSSLDVSGGSSFPQPGCLLEYSNIAHETRISNDDMNNKQETGENSWGSKWMPGSFTSSSMAWRAQSGTADAANHNDAAFLALAQAAALTSHVVVLVILHKTGLNPGIVQALQTGFARRHEHAGLAKGSLVIVLNGSEDSEVDEWRSDLVMDAIQDVQPCHVHALELTSVEDYEATLKNLLHEQRVDSDHFDNLVPLQAFPQLLQQTYQALLLKNDPQQRQQQNTTVVASSLFDCDPAGNTQCTSEQEDSSLTSTLLLPIQGESMQNPGSRNTAATRNVTTTTATMKTLASNTAGDSLDDEDIVSPTASVNQNNNNDNDNNDNIITATMPEVQPTSVVLDDSSTVLENDEAAAKVLLAACHERLDALEQQLEQVWFDATKENDDDDDDDISLNDDTDESLSSSSPSSPAILPPRSKDFSTAATLVLQDLQQAYSTGGMLCNNKPLQDSVTADVGKRLSRLYQQYLQSLRDYHGKVYESRLDRHANQAENTKQQHGPWWRRGRLPFSRKRRRPSAARVEKDLQKTVQAFRKAAQDAVPELARRGNPFRDMDLDYVNVLQGLLADMQEAISLRESLVDLDNYNDIPDDDVDDAKRGGGLWGFIRRGRQPGAAATWYEKFAARAFVLSVNYVQGWLAWQALQRAALEREREMPKFPIF
jgi:hypothetical protein